MPNVFPYLGSYGSRDTISYRSLVHEYDDNSYRMYTKSTAEHRIIELSFNRYSKTKRDAIVAFFRANWNLEFYLYVWPEAAPSDLSGNTGTGRHLARFGPNPELGITNESSCAYTGSLTIHLLS